MVCRECEYIDVSVFAKNARYFYVHFAHESINNRFGAGSVGPAVFGLGQRTSFLTILVVDLMSVLLSSSATHSVL